MDAESRLRAAARLGDAAAVQSLLAGGADPETQSDSGSTPLHCACAGNQPEIIEAIFRAVGGEGGFGQALAVRNRQGRTPVCEAARHGCTAALETLLALLGQSPLELPVLGLGLAIEGGHVDCVRLLAHSGRVNVNGSCPSQRRPQWGLAPPLLLAVRYGIEHDLDDGPLRALLDGPTPVNWTAARSSAYYSRKRRAKHLVHAFCADSGLVLMCSVLWPDILPLLANRLALGGDPPHARAFRPASSYYVQNVLGPEERRAALGRILRVPELLQKGARHPLCSEIVEAFVCLTSGGDVLDYARLPRWMPTSRWVVEPRQEYDTATTLAAWALRTNDLAFIDEALTLLPDVQAHDNGPKGVFTLLEWASLNHGYVADDTLIHLSSHAAMRPRSSRALFVVAGAMSRAKFAEVMEAVKPLIQPITDNDLRGLCRHQLSQSHLSSPGVCVIIDGGAQNPTEPLETALRTLPNALRWWCGRSEIRPLLEELPWVRVAAARAHALRERMEWASLLASLSSASGPARAPQRQVPPSSSSRTLHWLAQAAPRQVKREVVLFLAGPSLM